MNSKSLEYLTGFLVRAGALCERCLDPRDQCQCEEDHKALERQPDQPEDSEFEKAYRDSQEEEALYSAMHPYSYPADRYEPKDGRQCRYCDSPNVAFSKAVSGISEDGLVEHEGIEYACFECIDPVSEKGWERL